MKRNHYYFLCPFLFSLMNHALSGCLAEKSTCAKELCNSKEIDDSLVKVENLASLLDISPRHTHGICREYHLRLDRTHRVKLSSTKTSLSPSGNLICNAEGESIYFFDKNNRYSRETAHHIIGDCQTVCQSHITCLDDAHIAIYHPEKYRYKVFNYLTCNTKIGNSLGMCKKIVAAPYQKGFLIDSQNDAGNQTIELASIENPFYSYLLFSGQTGTNNPFAIAKKANLLAAGSSDKKIYLWDFENNAIKTKKVIKLNSKPMVLSFDPYGNYLCVATKDAQTSVLIFESKKLGHLETIHLEPSIQHSQISFISWNEELLIQTQWGETFIFRKRLKKLLALITFCLHHLKKQAVHNNEQQKLIA